MAKMPDFISIFTGDAPLLVSLPHTGTDLPAEITGLVSQTRARQDADWWVENLYDFAASLGATTVRTTISRTVIDVNRDPSGATLYPGQVTTGLCPLTTFDGEPLYVAGAEPDEAEIARRRAAYFTPYHAALTAQITRLRERHKTIVIYDCHSIRSVIPNLFPGTLPDFNIGTNDGGSCAPEVTAAIEKICAATGRSRITNGRFKGGWITRHYANPANGIHSVQMELACSSYMREDGAWPSPYDPAYAAPMRAALTKILDACLTFARSQA
jgi:formiminoglutamase